MGPLHLINNRLYRLLHGNRFGQVAREIDIEPFFNGQPVSNQLQRNHVEQALEEINGLGDLDLLGMLDRKLFVCLVADDNRAATAGNNYKQC